MFLKGPLVWMMSSSFRASVVWSEFGVVGCGLVFYVVMFEWLWNGLRIRRQHRCLSGSTTHPSAPSHSALPFQVTTTEDSPSFGVCGRPWITRHFPLAKHSHIIVCSNNASLLVKLHIDLANAIQQNMLRVKGIWALIIDSQQCRFDVRKIYIYIYIYIYNFSLVFLHSCIFKSNLNGYVMQDIVL